MRRHYPGATYACVVANIVGLLAFLAGILIAANLSTPIAAMVGAGFTVLIGGSLLIVLSMGVRVLVDIEAAITAKNEPPAA